MSLALRRDNTYIFARKLEADPNLPGLVSGLAHGGLPLKCVAPSPLCLNLAHDVSWNTHTQPCVYNMSMEGSTDATRDHIILPHHLKPRDPLTPHVGEATPALPQKGRIEKVPVAPDCSRFASYLSRLLQKMPVLFQSSWICLERRPLTAPSIEDSRERASLKTQNPFFRLPVSLVGTLLSWEANAGSDLLRAIGWAVTERMPRAHDPQFGQKDTQKATHM